MQLCRGDSLSSDARAFGNGLKMPHGTMSIGVVVTPRISTMSTSHIIRDEATGVTYMDTVTTSVGRVALSSPDSEASSQGPTIEDVTGHE